MAVRAGFGVTLAKVAYWVDQHGMVDSSAGGAMVMAGKGTGMAIFAFAAAGASRADAGTSCGCVAGQAAICGMDLAAADKWCAAGAVAAHAVDGDWGRNSVDHNRGIMTVRMGIEVGGVALSTAAAHAAVDRRIAMSVYAKTTAAVGWVMTGGAGGMDCGDSVASVTGDAECGCGHRGYMVVTVVVEVGRMTIGAESAPDDSRDLWAVSHFFKGGRRGMAVRAEVLVDRKRVGCQMAERHTAWCVEQNAGCKVVDRGMYCWS